MGNVSSSMGLAAVRRGQLASGEPEREMADCMKPEKLRWVWLLWARCRKLRVMLGVVEVGSYRPELVDCCLVVPQLCRAGGVVDIHSYGGIARDGW